MRSERDGYEIDMDAARLDRHAIHAFLRDDAYWSPGVPFEVVDRAIDGSLPFGLYAPDGAQAGFARVVADGATFAWLADVFVLEAHRGRGLGKWLVETVLSHPALMRARRVNLATWDAHSLYERFGFRAADPTRTMELLRAPEDLYGQLPGIQDPG
jgi:GNAT superfamily N-acetyltransferase